MSLSGTAHRTEWTRAKLEAQSRRCSFKEARWSLEESPGVTCKTGSTEIDLQVVVVWDRGLCGRVPPNKVDKSLFGSHFLIVNLRAVILLLRSKEVLEV